MNTKKFMLIASLVAAAPLCAEEAAAATSTDSAAQVADKVNEAGPGIVAQLQTQLKGLLNLVWTNEEIFLERWGHRATRITSVLAAITAISKLAHDIAQMTSETVEAHIDTVDGDDDEGLEISPEELERYRRAFKTRTK